MPLWRWRSTTASHPFLGVFGNMPGDNAAILMLPSDWRRYCTAWPKIPDNLKALGIDKFWASPEVRELVGFREPLAQLGRW